MSPDGFCDKELIEETKLKIKYEDDAFALENTIGKPIFIDAFADAMELYQKENPNEFDDQNGIYRLLSPNRSRPFVKIYLRDQADMLRKGGKMSGSTTAIYHGEYRPCELLWELKDLSMNDPDYKIKRDKIIEEWNQYMNNPDVSSSILETLPYLQRVKNKFDEINK